MSLVRERTEGDTRYYHPDFHPGQQRAWASSKRFVAVIAGVRSGKTSFGAWWLWREMRTCGPGDYLIVAPNYPLIDKAAGPEVQSLFEQQLRLGKMRIQPYQFRITERGHSVLWPTTPYKRQSRILFGHADDPDSLEAMTVKAAWLDECGQRRFRLASWEAVQARLAIDRGRALLTSRPYDMGWLKQKIHDPWQAAGGNHPEIDLIRFDSTENPAFPRDEFERAKAELPRWKFDMMYRARFERPAGLVYDCFDPDRHTCPPFAIPDDWPRYLGLDFGGVNTCALYFAKEPKTDILYLYREYYPRAARTAKHHVEAILAGEAKRPTAIGGSHSEGQWRSEFAAAGLGVSEPAVKEVDVGITRVYAAFASDKVKVFPSCHRFLEEVATYSYKTDEAGNPLGTGEIEDKHDAHALDACRYIIGWLHRTGGARVGTSSKPTIVRELERLGVWNT